MFWPPSSFDRLLDRYKLAGGLAASGQGPPVVPDIVSSLAAAADIAGWAPDTR